MLKIARPPRLCSSIIGLIATIVAVPCSSQVTITVPSSNIRTGKPGKCNVELDTGTETPDSATVLVKFVSNDSPPKPEKSDATTLAQIDGRDVATIDAGLSEKSLRLASDQLTNGTLVIMRDDARVPLCSVVPWPLPVLRGPTGPEFTQFVADGAVGKVLRGASASEVTGSIGLNHRSLIKQHRGQKQSAWSKWTRPLAFWNSDGEELHALLTVAGSADSLLGPHSVFGSALLAPGLSGSGSIQGATIDYHYFTKLNRSGGTWGPRIRAVVARSIWRVVDTTAVNSQAKVDTLRQAIPLTALDIGFRFAFINHLVDPKGNTYSVGLDLNFLSRFASPNSEADNHAVRVALGSSRHRAQGLGTSFWIRLRQVTATADFPKLRKKNQPIDGLTGIQPTVTIKYSSPLFQF